MTKRAQARACRDMAVAFPELADVLGRIEIHFLRISVEKSALTEHSRSLQMRRIEAGAFVDLIDDLKRALHLRETGMLPDIGALRARTTRIADDIDAAREASRREIDRHRVDAGRLRQASALLAPLPHSEITALPDWFEILGDRDARQWDIWRQDRALRNLRGNPKLANWNLEDLIVGEFASRMLGSFGSLPQFFTEAYGYYNSPWFWSGDSGTRELYAGIGSRAIGSAGSAANIILQVLWDNPRIWRDMSSADRASRAMVEAIISITETIRFFSCKAPAFPEESLVVISMNNAIERLKDAASELRREVEATFPGRIDFEAGQRQSFIDGMPYFSGIDEVLGKPGRLAILEFISEKLKFLPRPKECQAYFMRQIFDWYRLGRVTG